MRIERLSLQDFRNYSSETVEFEPGLNLVTGANAQGKTNLLEAIYCLGGMGSPRGPDAALVRDGAERAVLNARVVRGSRRVEIDLEFRPGRGIRALISKTPVSGTRPLRELVVGVFFGPDELSLVKGAPEGRRRFVDELVVKLRPAREDLRRDFERVLKQRNALLRNSRRGSTSAVRPSLEVWDEALAVSGSALAAERLAALGSLAPYVSKRYEEVAGSGRIELEYSSSWLPERVSRAALLDPEAVDGSVLQAALSARIDEMRERELERGQSLVGPQRDDIVVRLAAGSGEGATLDARTYASQGDQRTCALALKLAEHDLLSEALGDQPILLLDDVFSELDPRRRTWLSSAVRAVDQTVLSSAEPGAAEAAGAAHAIEVAGGRVKT